MEDYNKNMNTEDPKDLRKALGYAKFMIYLLTDAIRAGNKEEQERVSSIAEHFCKSLGSRHIPIFKK